MRVAIVENTRVTHHGQIGVALHEAGARIDLFKPHLGQPLPQDAADHDALIVFGGEQNALADDTHPYLPKLAKLITRFTAADRATLGICLGSQLTARAFGGTNHIGTAPEFGWTEVQLTAEGQNDPVLGGLPNSFPIFQWHSDTFTLPQGALHLATSSGAANQAFRLGRATYATQFHFEANRNVVADWNREFPDLVEGNEPGWLDAYPARAATTGALADEIGLQIARAFTAQI